jgi:uroporphyrin-III C-methyltransferase
MQIDLDVAGRTVVIFGDPLRARAVLRRFVAGGATVSLASAGALPEPEQRLNGVRYLHQPEPDDRSGLLRLIGPAWMVVTVDVAGPLRRRVSDLASQLRVLIVDAPPVSTGGGVTLVGGGPGRTSLLTLEACAALLSADVVLYDRLAPTDDLVRLAPAAELLDVGKLPYHHRVDQPSIQELMIQRARRGQQVVRLKGGDPFVFGSGGEELHACLVAGIPVRVVPGVSSALAVPAACGIPLTHRGVSHAFTVISGHVAPSRAEYEALARLGGTIVILMGIANLDQIVAGLLTAGMAADVPAGVIERGFSSSQRSTLSQVGALAADARRLDVRSPAVVVIGEVVAVAPRSAGSDGVAELVDVDLLAGLSNLSVKSVA